MLYRIHQIIECGELDWKCVCLPIPNVWCVGTALDYFVQPTLLTVASLVPRQDCSASLLNWSMPKAVSFTPNFQKYVIPMYCCTFGATWGRF